MMRWKLDPAETGLRAVGAGPRSSKLSLDGEKIAWVCPLGGGWRGPITGWYFVALQNSSLGIEHKNTCTKPASTVEEAKAQAVKYVKTQMKTHKEKS